MSSGPGAASSFDERYHELSKKLLKDRIVFVGTPIDGFIAKNVIAQLLMLAKESPESIRLYVNSPGGYVSDSLAIYDAIRQSRVNVSTVCIGQASGMAALLVAAGARGQRVCLPTARFQ